MAKCAFLDAWSAEQKDVFAVGDERVGFQFPPELLFGGRLLGEVEFIHGAIVREVDKSTISVAQLLRFLPRPLWETCQRFPQRPLCIPMPNGRILANGKI